MKNLGRNYKKLLEKISDNVRQSLGETIHDPRFKILHKSHPFRTDTFGWYINIAKFRGIPGEIQIWLDLFPNVNARPILSICYNHGDIERVNLVAFNVTPERKNEKADLGRLDEGPYKNGGSTLLKPLPKKLFGKFIVESYGSSFLTTYLYDIVHFRQIRLLSKKSEKICKELIRGLSSAKEGQEVTTIEYVAVENRKKVVQHLRRERSSKLALLVKQRDGFTCQICDFNFAEKYGEFGRGFAEVHHIVPLAKLKPNIRTTKDDLITVCANCHRTLHYRTYGESNDIKNLKATVRNRK